MHVSWLISAPLERRGERLYSPMASVRYRALFVAEHLFRLGHRTDLICAGADPNSPELQEPLSADVVIVSKGLFEGSVAMAERAKSLGACVLVDICDDHFDDQFGEIYFALCKLADGLVASTPTMAQLIQVRTNRTATVIDDPYEAPSGEPRFAPHGDRLRLLWFGHPTNFDTLVALVPSLSDFNREQSLELHVVSQLDKTTQALFQRISHALSVRFTDWSQEATWQAIAECDAVVIPSLPTSVKLVKSPNRLIESLRLGRFACAYPLPSYAPFRNYTWLGENIVDGLRWGLAHPQEACERIAAGQCFVADQFAPEKLASRWECLIAASRHNQSQNPLSMR